MDLALTKRDQRSISQFLHNIGEQSDVRRSDNVLMLAGGAIGGLVLPEHRVLGVLGGASLGRNMPALLSPTHRQYAVRNMASTGAGIAGSLLGGKQGRPVIGFIVGWLAAETAFFFFSGGPTP